MNRAAMLATMERRLLHGIMLPAAVMSYGFGLLLAATPGVVDSHRGWIWAKLTLVVLLTAFHILLAYWRRDLARGGRAHSSKFYRLMNELPTVMMIAIVLLVVPTRRMIWASLSSGWLRSSQRMALGRSWRRETGV